jgi:transcription elongation factor Elf1
MEKDEIDLFRMRIITAMNRLGIKYTPEQDILLYFYCNHVFEDGCKSAKIVMADKTSEPVDKGNVYIAECKNCGKRFILEGWSFAHVDNFSVENIGD